MAANAIRFLFKKPFCMAAAASAKSPVRVLGCPKVVQAAELPVGAAEMPLPMSESLLSKSQSLKTLLSLSSQSLPSSQMSSEKDAKR